MKKILIVFLMTLMFVFPFSRSSYAIDPVIDAANLVQSVMSVLSSDENVSNQMSQIDNQYTMIQNQLNQLKGLGGDWAPYRKLLHAIGADLQI